ncbi:hypothetical protein [Methylobacterium sp. 77]|uniref:DUF6894 family protein n=1 Tax=Methylobacterium sp. 77 TaxID=1101192 RepID=UPI00035CFFA3|nr:hypothetical protein [Methylobacterium sp. 77]
MARYFIHLQLRGDQILDTEGREFATLDAVHKEAVASARQMIAFDLMQGLPLSEALDGVIDICDGGGATVAFVPFPQAAELRVIQGSSILSTDSMATWTN